MTFEIILLIRSIVEIGESGLTADPALSLVGALAVLTGIGAVFHKAGRPWWACLVPVFAEITLLRIVARPTWWLVPLLLPMLQLFELDDLAAYAALLGIAAFVTQLILFVLLAQRFEEGNGVLPRHRLPPVRVPADPRTRHRRVSPAVPQPARAARGRRDWIGQATHGRGCYFFQNEAR